MKNYYLRLTPLSFLWLSIYAFVSCSKSDTNSLPSAPLSTSLQITAIDNAGVRQAGATVALYTSQTNFFSETGAVTSGTTDANGQITFSNLSAVRYWYLTKKGCLNNANSSTATTTAIPANTTTSISTTLSSTGTLRMVNMSTNPYHVYVNGFAFPDMPGGTSVNYNYEKTGAYTIRVVQISGYVATPTDLSFQGTLVCGGTLTTTFP